MKYILAILGVAWAILGVANLLMMDWHLLQQEVKTLGVIINVVLFIFPGLALSCLWPNNNEKGERK